MPTPNVVAVSSTAVNITWLCPDPSTDIRGAVRSYTAYQLLTNVSVQWTVSFHMLVEKLTLTLYVKIDDRFELIQESEVVL
jgi:hypothetical protein